MAAALRMLIDVAVPGRNKKLLAGNALKHSRFDQLPSHGAPLKIPSKRRQS